LTRVAAHRRARSHEVFDPQAQPSHRDPPLPGFDLSGSRCALTLTMRLGALLPRRPPWYYFNQARSRDPHPSELDLTEVAVHLSMPAVPLAIGHAGPLSTPKRGSRCFDMSSKRPRFRACPAAGWGSRTGRYPVLASPGSLGFRLPGALPFHAPTLQLTRYPFGFRVAPSNMLKA